MNKWEAFAREVIETYQAIDPDDWHDIDLDQLAQRHDLLVPVPVMERCERAWCLCFEMGKFQDDAGAVDCWRLPAEAEDV